MLEREEEVARGDAGTAVGHHTAAGVHAGRGDVLADLVEREEPPVQVQVGATRHVHGARDVPGTRIDRVGPPLEPVRVARVHDDRVARVEVAQPGQMLRGPRADGEVGALRHWLVFGLVVGVAVALVLAARHVRLLEAPPLLATAAGVLYGLQDALTRTSTTLLSESGITGLVTSWQPYVIVALAVTGLMLVQSAFETGPLRMSLPALTAAEPLAGIACGIGFLGDRVSLTPGALAAGVTGLVCVVAGVFLLGRHPAMPTGQMHLQDARHVPPQPLEPNGQGRQEDAGT